MGQSSDGAKKAHDETRKGVKQCEKGHVGYYPKQMGSMMSKSSQYKLSLTVECQQIEVSLHSAWDDSLATNIKQPGTIWGVKGRRERSAAPLGCLGNHAIYTLSSSY